MDKILVAGIDTVVGANLAAWLANRFQVVGLSWTTPLAIAGCETAVCDPGTPEAAQRWIAAERPQWIVFCGPSSVSSWNLPATAEFPSDCVASTRAWAQGANQFNCEFTFVSSDAVFTGPWMFHRESGTCFCDSPQGRMLRLLEKEVIDNCPSSLIIRTNAFGWSPLGQTPALIESIVSALRSGKPLSLDCVRHGTPILATDLAEALEAAYEKKLRGLYHLGGGERVSPFRFAYLLAELFGLDARALQPIETVPGTSREFGAGESSLQTRRIRKAIDRPLPLIREGLARLHEQFTSGYRDRFSPAVTRQVERVA